MVDLWMPRGAAVARCVTSRTIGKCSATRSLDCLCVQAFRYLDRTRLVPAIVGREGFVRVNSGFCSYLPKVLQ